MEELVLDRIKFKILEYELGIIFYNTVYFCEKFNNMNA